MMRRRTGNGTINYGLDGKVAVITGGASGIGLACATRCSLGGGVCAGSEAEALETAVAS